MKKRYIVSGIDNVPFSEFWSSLEKVQGIKPVEELSFLMNLIVVETDLDITVLQGLKYVQAAELEQTCGATE